MMKGWACCVLICHQQKRTFGGWRTSSTVESWPIFVFRVTFYVHRGSGQARVYPRRWLSLSSRAKAFTLKGRHRRFVGDSAFHTSLRGAPLLVGEQRSGIQYTLPRWSEFKSRVVLESVNHNIGAASACRFLHVVYKNDWSSAFLPGCACVHLPTMTPRVKPPHTLVSVLHWLCYCRATALSALANLSLLLGKNT